MEWWIELLRTKGTCFVITSGRYDDYFIHGAFREIDARECVQFFQTVEGHLSCDPTEHDGYEKRIEVWNGSKQIGTLREVVIKAEFDIMGDLVKTHGLKFYPEGEDE